MTITVENLVSREVHYCVSYLVSTLAQGFGAITTPQGARSDDLGDMIEQAFELACPIDDWEEAAFQAGYKERDGEWHGQYQSAQDACEANDVEPYQREVYEHWIVSDWLADKLAEHGEKVDKDFAGLTVWARTCTGQGIANDSVLITIHAELTA